MDQFRPSTLGLVVAANIAAIGIGVALLFHGTLALSLLVWLLSLGLILTGGLRLAELGDDPKTKRPYVIASAAVLVLAGMLLPWGHSEELPLLALSVALVLLAAGLIRFSAVLKGPRQGWCRGLLTSLSGIFGSVLVVFWPRLSLWLLGVSFGMWLILVGVKGLSQVLLSRFPPVPGWIVKAFGSLRTTAAAIGLVFVLAFGVLTAALFSTTDAVADDFYLPPLDSPAEPGQLLRAEPLAPAAVPEGAVAWRILYTTTLQDSTPAVASAVVTIPDHRVGELPVISWANGTKGVTPRCALSAGATPYDDGPAPARREMLEAGWAIVATDYVGLGTAGPHPYLVPKAEAHAVLDATRAARQMSQISESGNSLSSHTVLWGHSQGGHAVLSTAVEAPDYAPELDILGVAAMAPASDLAALASAVGGSAAGKVVTSYITSSWDEIYPELHLRTSLSRASQRAVNDISGLCFTGTDVLSAMARASQLFEPIFSQEALEGALNDRLELNSAPIPTDLPVFIAQGASDSLVRPEMQRGFVAEACTINTQTSYKEYEGLEHMGLVGETSALNRDLVDFTRGLLDGEQHLPDLTRSCGE